MNEELFSKMLKEAGMSEKQFVEKMGFYGISTLKNWSKTKYPPYIQPILEWAIKAKKYKDLVEQNSNFINSNNPQKNENFNLSQAQKTKKMLEEKNKIEQENKIRKQIIKLERENKELKDKIQGFKELKSFYIEMESHL